MQYYYECLDIYEKLVPEVKNHCISLQKLERQYTVMKDALLRAAEEVNAKSCVLSCKDLKANSDVISSVTDALVSLAKQKRDISRSLVITVDFYLSRLYGYLREFSCEADCETPGTSLETDRKRFPERVERMKIGLRRLNSVREEFPVFDQLLSLPPPESLESVNVADTPRPSTEPTADYFKDSKLNGHRQNIVHTYQFIQESFRDEETPVRSRASTSSSVKRQGHLRIKTERRGSLAGSPSPRSLSPRTSKMRTDANFFQPSPSYTGTASPMDMSPMPSGSQNTFNYDNTSTSGFTSMPSFLSSHESRHGRQRKFTPKAQQMFKEKHGLGRPSHYTSGSSNNPNVPGPSGTSVYSGGLSSAGLATTSQVLPSVASSSYSFPQDFNRLPAPNQQQQQHSQHQIMGPPRLPQQSMPPPSIPYQRQLQLTVGQSESSSLGMSGLPVSRSPSKLTIPQSHMLRSPSSSLNLPPAGVSRPPSAVPVQQLQHTLQGPSSVYANNAELARQRQDSTSMPPPPVPNYVMQSQQQQRRVLAQQQMMNQQQQPRPSTSVVGGTQVRSMKSPLVGGNGLEMPSRPQQIKSGQSPGTSHTLVRYPSNVSTNGDGQMSNRTSSPATVEEEDDRPWCFCGDRAYGDMVECSNRRCLYIWFHFQCVGITSTPAGSWFCPQCRKPTGESMVEN